MKTAILANIFANMTALEAVAKDAAANSVDRFVCLGDSVGAGPHPVECLRWLKEHCAWSLRGYWDSCLADPSLTKWSSTVHKNEVLRWNRELVLREADGQELIQHFATQVSCLREDTVFYVFGSVRDPEFGYAPDRLPADGKPYKWDAAESEFAALPEGVRRCFAGRLGCPCVVGSDGVVEHASAQPGDRQPKDRTIVNVGSVGLPQDGDPRAAYVLHDGKSFVFRRVTYDVEQFASDLAAARKLSAECLRTMIYRHQIGK